MSLEQEIELYKSIIKSGDDIKIEGLAKSFINDVKSEPLFSDNYLKLPTIVAEAMIQEGDNRLALDIAKVFTNENLDNDSLLKLVLYISRLETEEFIKYRETNKPRVTSTSLAIFLLHKIKLSHPSISGKTVEIVYGALFPKESCDLNRYIIEDYFSTFKDIAALSHIDFIINTIYHLETTNSKTLLNMRNLTQEVLEKNIATYLKDRTLKVSDFLVIAFSATPIYLLEMEIIKFANNSKFSNESTKMFNARFYEINEICKEKLFKNI